jgi:hypothetical protein
MRPLDFQATYQQMMQRGQSARTARYTHVVLRYALRQGFAMEHFLTIGTLSTGSLLIWLLACQMPDPSNSGYHFGQLI